MIAASAGATARNASSKVLIKKLVGLIVVVVVCVAVVVIVLKVLNKFGDSSDDAKEDTNFEGKPTCKLWLIRVNAENMVENQRYTVEFTIYAVT